MRLDGQVRAVRNGVQKAHCRTLALAILDGPLVETGAFLLRPVEVGIPGIAERTSRFDKGEGDRTGGREGPSRPVARRSRGTLTPHAAGLLTS